MGQVVGGRAGMAVAFAIALAMNLASLWKSDRMVLRIQGASEVDPRTGGDFYAIVQDLASRAGLPPPRVYVMQSPQPNAFATGRGPGHAAVCASSGLLEMLPNEEVAGVMAHELSHVKNRDTLTMSVAATIGGAISMFAQYLQIGALFGRGTGAGRLGGIVRAADRADRSQHRADGDQSRARVRGRSRGRLAVRPSAVARRGAAAHRGGEGDNRPCAGRGGPRARRSVHDQPAAGAAAGALAVDASEYAGAHRGARTARPRDGGGRGGGARVGIRVGIRVGARVGLHAAPRRERGD